MSSNNSSDNLNPRDRGNSAKRGHESNSASLGHESEDGTTGDGVHSSSSLRGESDSQGLDVASSFYLSWQSDSGQEIQRKLLVANKFLATQVWMISCADSIFQSPIGRVHLQV